MSVFGSLFTAVSGLSAQGQSIAMISNNIANVSTIGYKRTDAAFSSLVTSAGRSTQYSPGAVLALQAPRVDQQGILQQTGSPTDIAISGNGLFVVKPSATDFLAEPLYTRNGTFTEDSSGFLKNAAGFYLQGWPLDRSGNLPASMADISSLEPVDVAFLGGMTLPTTTAQLSINLKADEAQTTYPVPVGTAPNFIRAIKMFDSLGAGHDLTASFTKMTSPTTTVSGINDLSGIVGDMENTAPFTAADNFSIDVGGAVPASTVINLGPNITVAEMLAQINALVDINNQPVAFATLDTLGRLSIKATNTSQPITLTDGVGAPLANPLKLGMAAFIGANAAPVAPTLLTATPNTPNTEGWWNIDFTTPSGAVIQSGAVNFTGDGQLNATQDTNNQVLLNFAGIDWNNGSNPQDIDYDIAGFTQFTGEYNVVGSAQNGAGLGLRTGVSIDEDGFVTAQFSNGQSTQIYKIAVATFPDPNGLTELTGNVYRQSDASGEFNLREAGHGSAGTIAGGALEASNVDLADEFAKMIVTQRAYSANTKVISTADQMTQELLQLR
jgi:flagellar hook protein FlgE